MGRKCCVPHCRGNYDESEKVSVFAFPKDEAKKKIWLDNIQRDNFIPSSSATVCERHFMNHFILKFLTVRRPDGSFLSMPRSKLRLSDDAYPSIFPHRHQSTFNTMTKAKGKGTTLKKKWKDKVSEDMEDEINQLRFDNYSFKEWLEADKITSFLEFSENFSCHTRSSKLLFRLHAEDSEPSQHHWSFYFIEDGICGAPKLISAIKVFNDLHVEIFSDGGNKILVESLASTFGDQQHLTLVYWSQFVSLISQCSGELIDCDNNNQIVAINDLHGISHEDKEDEETQALDTAVSNQESSGGAAIETELLRLNEDLFSAVIQRNELVERMNSLQSLANIDLDLLSLTVKFDESPECREELEKVLKLVHTVMDIEEIRRQPDIPSFEPYEDERPESCLALEISQLRPCDEDNACDAGDEDNGDNVEFVAIDSSQPADYISLEAIHNGVKDDTDIQWPVVENDSQENLTETGSIIKETDTELGTKVDEQRNVCSKKRERTSYKTLIQCTLCVEKFIAYVFFRSHCDSVHSLYDGFVPFKCLICDKTFDIGHHCDFQHKTAVKTKEKSTVVPKTAGKEKKNRTVVEKVACKFCGKLFDPKAIKTHERRVHTTLCSIRCSICGKQLRSKGALRTHMAYFHSDDRPYQCSQCGKTFKTSTDVSKHSRYTHSPVRKYVCTICNKGYKSPFALTLHQRSHSHRNNIKVGMHSPGFPCYFCDESFSYLNDRKVHMRCHQPYKCAKCGATYKYLNLYEEHLIYHSENPLQCKVCHKIFQSHKTLRYHKIVHTDEFPFQCSFCSKKFKWQNSLSKHERMHREIKPFKCAVPNCGKQFVEKSRLKAHQTCHEEGKFKCDACDKVFKERRNLLKHGKVHSE